MSPTVYRFGVAQNAAGGGPRLLDEGARFAAELGERIDATIELDVAQDYADLLSRLLVGRSHIAWMPPLVHARATLSGATLAAVCERDGSFTYRSALLVRADSPYRTLRDLAGARFAWVDPSSAAGYVFPRLELVRAGLDPDIGFPSEKFHGTVASAADAVSEDRADVCACFVSSSAADDHATADAEVRAAMGLRADRLRVLHVTDAIPPDGIVVAPTVDDATREALTQAVLALNLDDRGRAALKSLFGADSLASATEHLRRLIHRWAQAAHAGAARERTS